MNECRIHTAIHIQFLDRIYARVMCMLRHDASITTIEKRVGGENTCRDRGKQNSKRVYASTSSSRRN